MDPKPHRESCAINNIFPAVIKNQLKASSPPFKMWLSKPRERFSTPQVVNISHWLKALRDISDGNRNSTVEIVIFILTLIDWIEDCYRFRS
ncbi:hypothetical protein CDAR_441551 [Caerostris darwini]|uniref:Uncharacterized protein n=1 Tax=Caerostris darwini TaxID=1538125 RepID=A0AAV4SDC0_9ARAC|nr:hypothetical protein CDAR_441551 [Caerostris darwini]